MLLIKVGLYVPIGHMGLYRQFFLNFTLFSEYAMQFGIAQIYSQPITSFLRSVAYILL